MINQQVQIINFFLMIFDALCIAAAGYGAIHFYDRFSNNQLMVNDIIILSVTFIVVLTNYILGKFNLYSDRRPLSYFSLLYSIIKTVIIAFAILSALTIIFAQFNYPREFLIHFGILSFFFLAIERLIARFFINRFSSKGYNARRLLVVGNLQRGKIVSRALERQLSWGHEIVGRLAIRKKKENITLDCTTDIGCLEDLPDILRTYPVDEVIFALEGDRSLDLPYHLSICTKMGVPAKILPALWEPGKQPLSVEKYQGIPFLMVQAGNFSAIGLFYKRIIDLTGGLIGTILLFILYPFIATAIKLDSPGPVFFKQKRIGKNGRVFQLYKFRSMYQDAEKQQKELMIKNDMNGYIFKMEKDPRITPVGKWLRRTSLDEFPQFLNVLTGKMSLVGTRPPTPGEVDDYQVWHLKRISIKPGITGLWQISGRNQIKDFDKIVELDCEYIDNWHLGEDFKILFRTIVVVLQRKGAI